MTRFRNAAAIPMICLALALLWVSEKLKWLSDAAREASTRIMGDD
jgi:hypothetical protein